MILPWLNHRKYAELMPLGFGESIVLLMNEDLIIMPSCLRVESRKFGQFWVKFSW